MYWPVPASTLRHASPDALDPDSLKDRLRSHSRRIPASKLMLRLQLTTRAAVLSRPVPLYRNLPGRRFEDEAPRRLMTRAHGVRLGLFSSCYHALI